MIIGSENNHLIKVGIMGACMTAMGAGLFLTALCAPAHALPQNYPNKPIRLLLEFPPGSASNTLARILGQQITALWGQPVVVDSRTTAGGNLATEAAAKASPDGYTILWVSTRFATVSSLYKNLPFDTTRDFAPICLVSTAYVVLVTSATLPVKSVSDLIALAKSKPGQLSYGSSGNGGNPHLAMELFKSMAKLDIVHIPYKGLPPALPDLIGGQIQMIFATVAPVLLLLQSEKLRALAISAIKRSPTLPDIPTMAETLPGFEAVTWQGILAPAGTPSVIIAQLNDGILKIIRMPSVHKRMVEIGFDPAGSTPAEFADYIKSEGRKWAQVIKASGARVD